MPQKIHIVGDIHGDYNWYRNFARLNGDCISIQIGDFGLGFNPLADIKIMEYLQGRPWLKLIRGNHDNPALFNQLPENYLGDFGYNPEWKLFWLSGAFSIDWEHRVEGRSWWRDEELSNEQMEKAFQLYKDVCPQYVVTHDCPFSVSKLVLEADHKEAKLNGRQIPDFGPHRPTKTGVLLDKLFEHYQPMNWYFGHWHFGWSKPVSPVGTQNYTQFTCVPEKTHKTLEIY